MIEIKENMYVGKPCIQCGNTIRYKNRYECVECKKRRAKEYNARFRGVTGTYQGKPCPHGHTLRYKYKNACVECSNAANRRRYKEISSTASGREHLRRQSAAWRRKNRKKDNAYHRKWRSENGNSHAVSTGKWRKNNKNRAAYLARRRRALTYSAQGNFTNEEFHALCEKHNNICLCCKRDDVKLTADHVVPLSKGGSNTIDNIQPLCQSCNSKKSTKIIDYR